MCLIPSRAILLLSLCLGLGTLGTCQHKQGTERFNELELEVKGLIEDFHAAGLAIGVVEKGRVSYAAGFGYRDVEKKLPVDIRTTFGIGSVTKAFTAGLLGILEEKGKLTLGDRPQQHIAELAFFDSVMNKEIQIKHLLSHSSGVGQMSSESSCILFGSTDRNALIAKLKFLPPAAGVGESFMYSNAMYTLVGIVGERITGNSWEENIGNLIFKPLAMEDSRVGYLAASTAPNFAYGYSVLEENQPGRVLPEDIATRAPGGDIYSSVRDMTKWVSAWLQEGKYQRKQLLPIDYVREAMSAQQSMNTNGNSDVPSSSYGYGWMSSNFYGYRRVEHSGAISGYTSNVVLFPANELGIIVLSNQSNSSLPNLVARLFIDELLSIERDSTDLAVVRYSQIYPLDTLNMATSIDPGEPPTHALTQFVGDYFHPGYGKLRIHFEEGVLLAEFPFTTFRLIHEGGNVFGSAFTENIPQLMSPFLDFTFQPEKEKQETTLLINLGEEPVTFVRVSN